MYKAFTDQLMFNRVIQVKNVGELNMAVKTAGRLSLSTWPKPCTTSCSEESATVSPPDGKREARESC